MRVFQIGAAKAVAHEAYFTTMEGSLMILSFIIHFL